MGKSNTLRIQTRGNTATLFINDLQVGNLTGTPPSGGGMFGFYAESANSATGVDKFDFTSFAASAPQSGTPPTAQSASCPGTVVMLDTFPSPDPLLSGEYRIAHCRAALGRFRSPLRSVRSSNREWEA
jgi:hypothetical protein